MTRSVTAGSLIAALTLSSAAMAAESSIARLGAVNGQVMVNRGDGFKPAAAGTALRAGDRVIVKGSGKAALNYADGCSVSLTPGSMATLNGVTPCKAGHRAAGLIGMQDSMNDDFRMGDEGAGVMKVVTVVLVGAGLAGVAGAYDDVSLPVSP